MSLKVLLISHKFYPSIGGIETVSELFAHAFTMAGHEVHVVTWSLNTDGKVFPFTVVRCPSYRKLFQEHSWANLVFENNPCLRLSWPGFFFRRPSLVALHTWFFSSDGKLDLASRTKIWWLNRASKVIAVSNAVRERCWKDAVIIGNSYNANDFKIISGIERSKDFVFIGRLVSDKGVDLGIKAIHLLNESIRAENNINTYSLTIIGDGPDRAMLEELVKELDLQEFVHFTGHLRGEELAKCLNQHRFLLVPSVWEEPFGVVALEGMACGCLPIVSDGGGLPDAVGRAGLTFKRGDVNSLVKCIKEVLSNPELEKEVRTAAEIHLAEHHPKTITDKYLDIIKAAANFV